MNANKLTSSEKKQINRALDKLCKQYFPSIPTAEIDSILSPFGVKLESGIYCGAQGECTDEIGRGANLRMTWYKMPSGNFEIVAYVC
jgi:hypothetical protein